MSERTAIVTGASRGIGRAVARRLAADGFSVVALARDAARLRQLTDDPLVAGRVRPVAVDLTAADALEALPTAAGTVEVLVCCAAAPLQHASVAAGDDAVWEEQFRTNVLSTQRLVAWAARSMIASKAARGGSMVFVSSASVRQVQEGLSAYLASKAAIETLMRCAAIELGRYGIRSNCVAPGLVDTERTRDIVSGGRGAEHRALTPLARLTTEDDIADIVAWLAGDRSGSVTGQVLVADGGRTTGRMRAQDD